MPTHPFTVQFVTFTVAELADWNWNTTDAPWRVPPPHIQRVTPFAKFRKSPDVFLTRWPSRFYVTLTGMFRVPDTVSSVSIVTVSPPVQAFNAA